MIYSDKIELMDTIVNNITNFENMNDKNKFIHIFSAVMIKLRSLEI